MSTVNVICRPKSGLRLKLEGLPDVVLKSGVNKVDEDFARRWATQNPGILESGIVTIARPKDTSQIVGEPGVDTIVEEAPAQADEKEKPGDEKEKPGA